MTNTKSEYTISSITDTNEHDLPDTDGDDKSSSQTPWDSTDHEKLGVFITNFGDQSLTARLERSPTHDSSMTQPAVDTGSVSVPVNDTSIISADNSVPLGYFRVVISFDTAPTSTDPSVMVRYQGI